MCIQFLNQFPKFIRIFLRQLLPACKSRYEVKNRVIKGLLHQSPDTKLGVFFSCINGGIKISPGAPFICVKQSCLLKIRQIRIHRLFLPVLIQLFIGKGHNFLKSQRIFCLPENFHDRLFCIRQFI